MLNKYSAKRRIILWTFLLIKAKFPFKNHHIDDYFRRYCQIIDKIIDYYFLTIISLRVFSQKLKVCKFFEFSLPMHCKRVFKLKILMIVIFLKTGLDIVLGSS